MFFLRSKHYYILLLISLSYPALARHSTVNDSLCIVINSIVDTMKHDSLLAKHYKVNSQKIIPVFSTTCDSNLSSYMDYENFRFGIYEYWLKRATINADSAFAAASQKYPRRETIKQKRAVYDISCVKKSLAENANVAITFAYDPIYRFLIFRTVEILKRPGFSRGYDYLVVLNDQMQIELLMRSDWME